MVPNAGHFAMQEAPATVTAIGDFLRADDVRSHGK